MKCKKQTTNYFFVDESGDPTFYDRYGNLIVGTEGCSKVFILGFIKTESPEKLRKELEQTRSEIISDEYLKRIPSIKTSSLFFHAKDDCQEVREKVFKKIVGLPFKSQFFVARKIESIFRKTHKANPDNFYNDLISKLFENQLHISDKNIIYFASRGNMARQKPLVDAITNAIKRFEDKWGKKVESEIRIFAQKPIGEPCLQVIDYMNWAVYRAFTKGEMRYFDFVRDRISLVVDLYDTAKYPKNYYNKSNPFDANKISPM
jgi:Protein of unknown function (DUF3800)